MKTLNKATLVNVAVPTSAALLFDGALVVSATLLMALSAKLSLPLSFSPVPITFQPFALLLIAFFLGSRRALATMVLYLLEGAAGLPVFSPAGPGGVAQLLGPAGGYLFSYPAVAYIAAGIYSERKTYARAVTAGVIAETVMFLFGASWFALLTRSSLMHAAQLTIFPYIPGDVLKLAAAAGIAVAWQRYSTRDR
jgi:biotin transport system substrate-specific component